MNVIVPYQCIRCGYTTKDKFNMRNHLYKKIKPCPALKTNTELTVEVKESILANRIYKEYKSQIKNIGTFNTSIANNENEKHFIYLIRPAENVIHNEKIYKVGRTIVKGSGNITRLGAYGKGIDIVLVCRCINSKDLERKILEIFVNKFDKHSIGNEYFIGDFSEMAKIIYNMIIKETNEINEIKDNEIIKT